MMKWDAIIIGGGACGLMCAVQAGYLGKKVLVIEKNDSIGAKILISGGGRCNYTNLHTSHENYISENEHFCKSAFHQWSVDDTIQFFESFGIFPEEKTLGQLFPKGKKAKDIVAIFEQLCHDLEQTIWLNAEVQDLQKTREGFELNVMHNGHKEVLSTDKVVIATGGLPIPKLGATDFAFYWARKFDLHIIETAAALVPLTITGKDEEWFAQLSGNTVFCEVSCNGQVFEENILFTHWGLSGPAILQISSYWRKGTFLQINFLPNENILDLILSHRKNQGSLLLSTFLHSYFSKKLVEAMVKYIPITKNLASLTNQELEAIKQFIHQFKVKPAGDKGYQKAEVMRGGIDTKELSSKTMEVKKVKGLYFGGESVDVTGWLGGYNFQWAWASAFVIAQDL